MATTTSPTTHNHSAHADAPGRRSTSYADDKAKILARLRRIEGQVRGIQKMVEQDQYCLDVLTQLSAIIAAARTTGLLVLEDHIRGCVVNAAENDREQVLDELNEAIERFTRTVG
jgi:CsoR family transcriptional regulator, copper-sensing transcriptional repressor